MRMAVSFNSDLDPIQLKDASHTVEQALVESNRAFRTQT